MGINSSLILWELLDRGFTDGIDSFDIGILHNNILYQMVEFFFLRGL